MKVAYVIPSLERGGAESLLVGQLPLLISAGIDPVIVTATDRVALLEDIPQAVEHRSLGLGAAGGTAKALTNAVRLWRRLRAVLTQCRPDVAHLNLFAANAWGRLAADGVCPTVTTWHNTDPWMADGRLNNRVRLRLARWSARGREQYFVAVSNGVRDWCEHHLRVPPSRVAVVYNGTDLTKVRATGPPERSGDARIVMVGRFYRQKAHDVALKALSMVHRSGRRFTADLLGDGPLRASMRELAEKLGLSDVVRFPGVVRDVQDRLCNHEVFLMPSRHEGLPMAALEAMASYVTPVVTRVSGLDEVVEHEVNGLAVPPEDPPALAKTITRVIDDDGLRRRLAIAARKTVETRFDLARQVTKLVGVYESVVRGGSGGIQRWSDAPPASYGLS